MFWFTLAEAKKTPHPFQFCILNDGEDFNIFLRALKEQDKRTR